MGRVWLLLVPRVSIRFFVGEPGVNSGRSLEDGRDDYRLSVQMYKAYSEWYIV